jgi:hypothetical protein
MNVLRMIKLDFLLRVFASTKMSSSRLFGWERQMNERVAEKREEELKWIWKRQMLDLLNGTLKYVRPTPRLPCPHILDSFFIPVVTMIATYGKCFLL